MSVPTDANKIWVKQILTNYQEFIGSKMKGSNFAFDHADGLSHLYHQITTNPGGSYIQSPAKTKKQI